MPEKIDKLFIKRTNDRGGYEEQVLEIKANSYLFFDAGKQPRLVELSSDPDSGASGSISVHGGAAGPPTEDPSDTSIAWLVWYTDGGLYGWPAGGTQWTTLIGSP